MLQASIISTAPTAAAAHESFNSKQNQKNYAAAVKTHSNRPAIRSRHCSGWHLTTQLESSEVGRRSTRTTHQLIPKYSYSCTFTCLNWEPTNEVFKSIPTSWRRQI